MGGIKLVCDLHGYHVGGCNCTGALERVVRCPCPQQHDSHAEKQVKPFTVNR